MTDVRLQQLSELVQGYESRLLVLGQFLRAPAQVDVLHEHAHDRLMIGRPAAREARQEDLLLDREMTAALRTPEVQEAHARRGGIGTRRASQRERGEQAVVMIARQRRQLLAALHTRGSIT